MFPLGISGEFGPPRHVEGRLSFEGKLQRLVGERLHNSSLPRRDRNSKRSPQKKAPSSRRRRFVDSTAERRGLLLRPFAVAVLLGGREGRWFLILSTRSSLIRQMIASPEELGEGNADGRQ